MKKYLPIALILMASAINPILLAAPVNINKATAEQLAENLQGIGLKKAQLIVRYRKLNGAFQNKSDLLNVKGIGAETLEKNNADILLK